MMKRMKTIAAIAVVGLAAGCERGDDLLVIRDVAAVDVETGIVRSSVTVVIEAGRLAAVGEGLATPRSARVIDGAGRWMIPGLWDMHVHLAALEPVPDAPERLVAHGVTGVRDMGGRPDSLATLRDEIETGRRLGPAVALAGPTLNGDAPADFHRVVASPDRLSPTLDELVEWGADFVKIHNQLPPDVFRALAAWSARSGVRFAGHVPYGVGLIEASRAGMASFEHAEAWLEAEIFRSDDPADGLGGALERLEGESGQRLFETLAANGTALTPTLSAYRDFVEAEPDPARREMGNRLYARLAGLALAARRAGVVILAGTDTRSDPGGALHRELELLVEAGFTPAEALRAATVDAAAFLGYDARIVPGAIASLVLLDANPLDDVAGVREISTVILRERIVSGDELRALRP